MKNYYATADHVPVDLYTAMFLLDFVNFAVIILGFNSFGVSDEKQFFNKSWMFQLVHDIFE